MKFISKVAALALVATALATPAQARVANSNEVYLVKDNILIVADARLDGHLRGFTDKGYGMIRSEDWRNVSEQRLSGNGVACYLSLIGLTPIGKPSAAVIYQLTCGSDTPSYATKSTDISVTRRYDSIKALVADTPTLLRIADRAFAARDTYRETGEPRGKCGDIPGSCPMFPGW